MHGIMLTTIVLQQELHSRNYTSYSIIQLLLFSVRLLERQVPALYLFCSLLHGTKIQ